MTTRVYTGAEIESHALLLQRNGYTYTRSMLRSLLAERQAKVIAGGIITSLDVCTHCTGSGVADGGTWSEDEDCSNCGGTGWPCQARAEIDSRGEGVSDLPFETVQLVVRALTQMGIATPDSQEHQAAIANQLVKELCWSVRDHWAGLNATDPPRPADAGKEVDRDGERYRWLRYNKYVEWPGTDSDGEFERISMEFLDAAIDAEIDAHLESLK